MPEIISVSVIHARFRTLPPPPSPPPPQFVYIGDLVKVQLDYFYFWKQKKYSSMSVKEENCWGC